MISCVESFPSPLLSASAGVHASNVGEGDAEGDADGDADGDGDDVTSGSGDSVTSGDGVGSGVGSTSAPGVSSPGAAITAAGTVPTIRPDIKRMDEKTRNERDFNMRQQPPRCGSNHANARFSVRLISPTTKPLQPNETNWALLFHPLPYEHVAVQARRRQPRWAGGGVGNSNVASGCVKQTPLTTFTLVSFGPGKVNVTNRGSPSKCST